MLLFLSLMPVKGSNWLREFCKNPGKLLSQDSKMLRKADSTKTKGLIEEELFKKESFLGRRKAELGIQARDDFKCMLK